MMTRGGEGGKKCPKFDDVICERPPMVLMNGYIGSLVPMHISTSTIGAIFTIGAIAIGTVVAIVAIVTFVTIGGIVATVVNWCKWNTK